MNNSTPALPMAYSGGRTIAFLGELIVLENRQSRGYGEERLTTVVSKARLVAVP
jgi:hypothetical protein